MAAAVFFCIINFFPPIVFSQTDYRSDANKQLDAFANERGAAYGTPRDPRTVAAYVIKILLGFMGMLFLVYAIYAGYLILMARGDETQVTKGKETLRTAIIGMIIILSAYSITLFVARIATNKQLNVEPLFNDEQQDGFRVRDNPDDFMPRDPLR